MPYSAVTQPVPLPLSQGGTRSSTLAVHSTLVSPQEIRTEPSACMVKWRWITTGRNSSARRPEGLLKAHNPFYSGVGKGYHERLA